ncbi:MAG: hypothetical protein DRO87_02605 [Candidatus Thorarchaeota archaeon]|nr:MAG: hypothetical protein DRP09_01885 [Candidatus Thorarchaeota archaeon]RLI59568.1 MAG: hypothetical protein DRO87_02605 [Candidatus Thorarchaeota archaeon]
MDLQALRGRNQRGICFASSHDSLSPGVYSLSHLANKTLADVRVSERVNSGTIVLDSRVYDLLACRDTCIVSLSPVSSNVPIVKELGVRIESTKGLDSTKIADAISQRVNDLRDDFDGLILQSGQELAVERLALRFFITDVRPTGPSRVEWSHLERLLIEAKPVVKPCNVVVTMEIGGAARVEDAVLGSSTGLSRIDVFVASLSEFIRKFDQLGNEQLFGGFAFSDEVVQFEFYDPMTGAPQEYAPLLSKSPIEAYLEWVKGLLPDHDRAPSDLGDAISDSIELAQRMTKENGLPSVVMLFSSGVFSAGPNPVKSARRGQDQENLKLALVTAGGGSQLDILLAVGDILGCRPVVVSRPEDTDRFFDAFTQGTKRLNP